jgi:uncharacterized CHY-type Zn-finger protein
MKNYTCSICHKVIKMLPTNRIMRYMLDNEIMFDCGACNRFWLFKDFKSHTDKQQCIKDPKAVNHIDKIK